MKKLLIILLCLLPFLSSAQMIACRDSIKNGYNFWVYLPEHYADDTVELPVILFLHGKSLSGHNLSNVRRYGCLDAIKKGMSINAIVLAPQTPNRWEPRKVLDVYEWAQKHYRVDANRLYVIGMSLGGYGTLDFVGTYPEKVAAAIAMCGGSTLPSVCGLNDVPLWILHGTADRAVPVSASQKVVDNMAACGDTSLLRFDKMPGMNHSDLARVFYLEQTYNWLFSHSLADSVRMVDRKCNITSQSLRNAYKNLSGNVAVSVVDAKPDAVAPRSSDAKYYKVKPGNTLSGIAKQHHTTVTQLCKLNHLSRTSVLQIGQKIRVR